MTTPRAALIVVDLQEDFCPPNGALAVQNGREIASAINQLLKRPFALKLATRDCHPPDHISFASQHNGKSPFTSHYTVQNPENGEETEKITLWPDHCVVDTPGFDLIPELDINETHKIVDKIQDKRVEAYSAFGPPFRNPSVSMSKLDSILKEAAITHVFAVGIALDFCVKWTAIDAAERGYTTYVIEDAAKAVDQSEASIDATKKELTEKNVRVIRLDGKELEIVSAC